MIEQWKPVVGFEGRYEVSTEGRVRSLLSLNGRGAGPTEPRFLRPSLRGGYPFVVLHAGGRRHNRSIHLLVADAFLGPPPPGQEVRHLDGNVWNIRLSNLAHGTKAQNEGDKIAHGTRLRGEAVASAKLSDEQVVEIAATYVKGSYVSGSVALGRRYGVDSAVILGIVSGRLWAHVGRPKATGEVDLAAEAAARKRVSDAANTPRGEQHGSAILTACQVQAIRAEHAQAKAGRKTVLRGTIPRLASAHGVSASTIHEVVMGRTWRAETLRCGPLWARAE